MESSDPFFKILKTEDEALITDETEEVFSQSNSKIRLSIGKSPLNSSDNPAPKF